MRKIEHRVRLCTILLLAFVLGMVLFLYRYHKDSKNWYIQTFNGHLYSQTGELLAGTICDRNGTVLSTVNDKERTYSYSPLIRKATLHIIGDPNRMIGTGAVYGLRNYLLTYDEKNGATTLEQQGNTVTLSIDSAACVAAYQALGDAVGCVGVYNYKTGEILCLVSTPTFDPENIPEDLETNEAYKGVYVNRFISSTFTPGSVFKTLTLQAALEQIPDVESRTFTCEGSVRVGDNVVTCTKAHGEQTLTEAYANSCNCAFSVLASEIGGETLSLYVNQAGLTRSYEFPNFSSAKGTFELASASTYQVGWAGVGLYHNLVNPCSLMVYLGAIANGGKAAKPSFIHSVTTNEGLPVEIPKTEQTDYLLLPSTADSLKDYLINNVDTVYGHDRFPSVIMGAKTGTIEQKTGLSNCWFTGFLDSEEYPYAFVVYMENAGSGNRVAGAVAGAVLNALIPVP